MKRRKQLSEAETEIVARRYVVRTFYCEGCGTLLSSYENDEGVQRITCRICGLRYIRRSVGRRHIRSDMYAPEGLTFQTDKTIYN